MSKSPDTINLSLEKFNLVLKFLCPRVAVIYCPKYIEIEKVIGIDRITLQSLDNVQSGTVIKLPHLSPTFYYTNKPDMLSKTYVNRLLPNEETVPIIHVYDKNSPNIAEANQTYNYFKKEFISFTNILY